MACMSLLCHCLPQWVSKVIAIDSLSKQEGVFSHIGRREMTCAIWKCGMSNRGRDFGPRVSTTFPGRQRLGQEHQNDVLTQDFQILR
ncbi:hypothetical protein BDZ45DRAFT_671712 [Acephala macrosclerotiorum]|nr:hypothetical protein BDZ45DRAFT_671712 [Acephala macrosclerotiorum]